MVLWPSAAPSAYEEMLGYALWPSDYSDRFWAHGPRDIMQAMMAPSEAFAGTSHPSRGRSSRTRLVNIANASETTGDAVSTCIERAKISAMKPIDRIPATITLTDAQRGKLEALRSAATEAIDREWDACANDAPVTPPQRIQAMIRALWSLRYAEFGIRTALADFFNSLNDAQKTQLSELQNRHPTPATLSSPAQLCGEQGTNRPDLFARFQKSLQVTDDQQSSYRMLLGASMELNRYLAGTCPEKTPTTPITRLDAAGDRIIAMLHAATGIEPILNTFYSKLSNEQRARLN
jgi:hypothetical protein